MRQLGTLYDSPWMQGLNWSAIDRPYVMYGLDFDLYASIPAVNRGVLREIDTTTGGSAKRAKAAFDGRITSESDAMRLGRSAHLYIVEGPEEFEKHSMVSATCAAVKGSGDQCQNDGKYHFDGEWFCGVKGHAPSDATEPTDYVKPQEFERIQRMLASIRESDAAALLKRPGFCSELTIVWPERVRISLTPSEARDYGIELTEPLVETVPVVLKTRIDRFAPPINVNGELVPGIIVDLKGCRSKGITDNDVSKAIVNAGLDIQAVMCRRAMAAVGYADCEFDWLFVESDEPFDCVVKEFGGDDLGNAEYLFGQLLRRWALSQHLDKWPGLCPYKTAGRYPKWRSDKLTNERGEMAAAMGE